MEIKTIIVLVVQRVTDRAVLGLAVPTPAAAFLIVKGAAAYSQLQRVDTHARNEALVLEA